MKVSIVGAGNVGATVADVLARMDLVQEVVLVDIKEGLPQGKALDIAQSGPIAGFDTRLIGTQDYGPTEGSNICVITAGLPRRPGMSRDDLLDANSRIVQEVTENLVRRSPDAILIVVSNPLDVMTYVAYETSGFEPQRVFGMAGVLDTARYRAFIAEALKVSVRDVQALLLGGHGDTMVPLPRYTSVAGIPVTELLDERTLAQIVERTRYGGGEIVNLLGTSAWYAPGTAVVEMIEAIIKDSNRILPVAAWLTGQYGIRDLFLGVPVKLGRGGIKEVIELKLTEEERRLLHRSAEHVRELLEAYKRIAATRT
ncbi:MAG: malate dehydrogenase [Bacteroidetes bacterium]|nr:malate dehydrogenase [Rhodothermia bacterium]MCS7155985.1 malate dehydrogenase [Bacteroidota bacterium]MCX7907673.1 malate dehydrogenase [Bacteroidota bacterium]MDW8137802.1 malate dehydrogenase [Bacteroidota bacterium]MDW8286347.1 malate dehydrogenase [Bacteroidota bacterium]